MTHTLHPIGALRPHPIEAAVVAVQTARGLWVRQCSCRTLIAGLTEIDLHCHYQDHLRAVKESAQ